jgi:K+/H+ antiporter YhaU regulatory subunit KhtT
MEQITVRHQPLPGVGDRFQLLAGSGWTVTVVCHGAGQRDLALVKTAGDQPIVTARLTGAEAKALAMLLAGVHITLTSS